MNETLPPTWPEYAVPLHPDFEWTPIDRNAPVAVVTLGRIVGTQIDMWRVDRCPYCGGDHWHGAGPAGDDPRRYLGGRQSHCDPGGEYRLVQKGTELSPLGVVSGAIRVAIDAETRALVWDKSDGACWYCGVEMHPFRNFHVDHYIPIVDGGSNDLANLVPACQACNSRKGGRPAESLRRFFRSGRFWFEK